MAIETQTIYVNKTKRTNWVLRMRIPKTDGPHPVMVLLHGWTGDEPAMWIFASRLPENYLLVAPRGPYKTPIGGYGWYPHRDDRWPSLDDLFPAVKALFELLTPDNFPVLSTTSSELLNTRFLGFSQGAALMYSFVLLHPTHVQSFAGLSGFLPEGVGNFVRQKPLIGKNAFIAHGSDDKLVNVEKARRSVEIIQAAGANVAYCEDSVGHKLSATCFRGLEAFFRS